MKIMKKEIYEELKSTIKQDNLEELEQKQRKSWGNEKTTQP
jgi:hypothetical protein